MRDVLRVATAAGAGALLMLAFPPAGWWPLAPAAIGALCLLLIGTRPLRGAMIGGAFGLGFFLPLLHWSGIYVGALPWVLLAVSQAVPVAAVGALAGPLSRLRGWPLWFAALWVAQEALRSRAPFGGFPWGRLAFSQASAPALRVASLGGAPALSFAVALAGALLALAARCCFSLSGPRRVRTALPAAAAGLAVAVSGLAVPLPRPTGPAEVVAVVQGNVPRLGLDFNAQRKAVLRNHVATTLDLARQIRAGRVARPALVIWPENASDIDPFRDASASALIESAVRAVGVPVLVGAVLDGPGRYVSNDGIVWDPATGPGERYVKRHPVPFGEYIPLRSLARRFSTQVDRVSRDFAAGDRPGLLAVGPARVGDVICFEVAYDGVVRDVVTAGADLLVVQTNNATFGRSGETQQQLAMGQVRAVEHGRTVVVAATSGISAVITADGRVRARTQVFTRDVLTTTVDLSSTRTLASRVGAWPEAVLSAVALLAVAGATVGAWRRRRRRRA